MFPDETYVNISSALCGHLMAVKTLKTIFQKFTKNLNINQS